MTDMSKEREAFQSALKSLAEKHGQPLEDEDFGRDASGEYENGATEIAWMLWQARASLSAEAEPAAWVDERAIAWLANSHSRRAEVTTTLSKEQSPERPMPIFAAPAQAPAPGWVSVDERLPEMVQACDWLMPATAVKRERWILAGESMASASVPGVATHWRLSMPLPAPHTSAEGVEHG